MCSVFSSYAKNSNAISYMYFFAVRGGKTYDNQFQKNLPFVSSTKEIKSILFLITDQWHWH